MENLLLACPVSSFFCTSSQNNFFRSSRQFHYNNTGTSSANVERHLLLRDREGEWTVCLSVSNFYGNTARGLWNYFVAEKGNQIGFRCEFKHILGYLSPFVVQCIVGLNVVQVRLTIISSHSVEPVSQQTHSNSVSGDTEGRHGCPCVRLWVIPAGADEDKTKTVVILESERWKLLYVTVHDTWYFRTKWKYFGLKAYRITVQTVYS